MKRLLMSLLCLTVMAGAVAACGRIGPPTPPADAPNTYPKAYPSAATQ